MVKLELVTIARIMDFCFKPFLGGPYLITKQGTVRYFETVRKLVYILHVTICVCTEFSLVFLVRPEDAFKSAYHILGYLRGFFQTFFLPCVVIWNVHCSRHLFNALTIIFSLKNDLPFSQKQMRRVLAWAIGEFLYAYSILLSSVSYALTRWGFSMDFLLRLFLIFFEFNAFSGEVTFINSLALLNMYSGMLNSEMDTLKSATFDLFYVRDLIKFHKTESNCDKINRIRIVYGKIYDAKEELHTASSFPLLVMTGTAFGNLVFFVFVNTLAFKYGTTVGVEKYLISGIYPTALVIKVIIAVMVCNTFKEKLKEGRLASARLFTVAVTEEETAAVTALIQELNSMDPEITCHRFVVIDHELITSMIGTIITYAVILLQSKFTDDGSDPVKSLLFEI